MTSHAAVVARGMGKCCVSGCGAIVMDEENKQFTLSGKTYHEGDWLSLDGSTGNIYDGAIPTVDASIGGEFGRVMGWADKYRRLQVRTNADFFATAFAEFNNRATIRFFERRGLKLDFERGDRVFPHSGKAWDVANTLEEWCRDNGVEFWFELETK